MNINVHVMIGPDEMVSGSAAELAQRVLEVFDGDPTKDTVSVNVSDVGVAGAMAPPIPPPSD